MLRQTRANLKQNKSYKRGVLSRSMAVRRLKAGTALAQWVLAATGRGIAIAHLVEAGTRPHWQPRRGIMHPGAKAKPFLEPAYFQHADAAVVLFGKELGVGIARFTRSIAYRGRK